MFFLLIKTQRAISLANAATNKLVGVGTLESISASTHSNFQCQQSSSDEQISSQDFHQTFLFLMPFCFWSQEKLSPWPLSTTSLPLLAYGINLSPPFPTPPQKSFMDLDNYCSRGHFTVLSYEGIKQPDSLMLKNWIGQPAPPNF